MAVRRITLSVRAGRAAVACCLHHEIPWGSKYIKNTYFGKVYKYDLLWAIWSPRDTVTIFTTHGGMHAT